MPYRMQSEYLRRLFLNNDLAEGRYRVDGQPVSLSDVRVPIFVVAALRDHIAPWRSVYRVTWLTQSDITFVLASGGHNVGIVSEPGESNTSRDRDYRISTIAKADSHVNADTWMEAATHHPGSWWPAWANWIEACSGEAVPPPPMGAPDRGYPPLMDAPGSYVLQR
jgi:polyhydroxyalkanoate synthase